jgi:hydroxylaminobenzene mutase
MPGETLRRRLTCSGAWLFAVGLVTGLWTAAVLTGKVAVPVPRLALAAHLNGLLGGLWLIAVAATLDMLRYGPTGRTRLAWVVAVPAWANWLITLIASGLGVTGLEYTRDTANNVVAVLLHSLVVLPSLAGAAAWAWGLGGRR